jgi:hypothetical protein
MKLHFGSGAEKAGLLMDFDQLKREYQRYEKWNPKNRMVKEYTEIYEDSYVEGLTKQLL